MLLSTTDWVGFWIIGGLIAVCILILICLGVRTIRNHRANKQSDADWPTLTGIISAVIACMLGLCISPTVYTGLTYQAIADDLTSSGWNISHIVSDSQVVISENGKYELVGVVQARMTDGSIKWAPTRTCFINPADFACYPPAN